MNGLTQREIKMLATYNAEVMRGIVHTEAYRRQMHKLQRIFDERWRGSIPGEIMPATKAMMEEK
jgi:hypothetical protein